MWDTTRPAREVFDEIERREVTDELAESAGAMTGDWDGKPWDPPAVRQPGVYAWGEAHLQYAYALQFEATRDPRYLDTLARRFRRLLALRDDRVGRLDEVRGRVMPGWGSVRFSSQPEHEGKYTSWAVHVGMIVFPPAQLVRLASNDPVLAARFAEPVREFRRAIVQSIAGYEDQWHERTPPGGTAGEPEGYYTEPIAGAAPLPLNQMNTLGRVMLELATASGTDADLRARYLDRVTKLARFLKNRMVLRADRAYQWDYRPGVDPPYDTAAEDTSHASINADFAVRCHHAGLVFDRDDMRRLARTFTDVIHLGPGRLADHVDGSGDRNLYGTVAAWWGELASIDPRVASIILDWWRAAPERPTGPRGMVTAAMLAKYGH